MRSWVVCLGPVELLAHLSDGGFTLLLSEGDELLGDVSILRDRRSGESRPLRAQGLWRCRR